MRASVNAQGKIQQAFSTCSCHNKKVGLHQAADAPLGTGQ